MVVYRRDTRRRNVLLLAILTSLVLITLDVRGNRFVDTTRDVARDVVAPVQDGVNALVDPIANWFDDIGRAGQLESDNEQLRRSLGVARSKLFELRAERNQLSELEALLDLPNVEDATGVPARVVGGAPGNYERTVQIDRGTRAGVRAGMPVLAGAGLVGKVIEASRERATIELLDGPGFGVGVRLEQSRVQGIAEGRPGEKLMRLGFLDDPRAKIAKGELVFTSGVKDAAFPPDLAVGRVVSVDRRRGNLDPDVRVRPVADLDRLEFVKVLRYVPPGGG